MRVDGVYPWGVTGFIPKPFLGHLAPTKVYYRAKFEEVFKIGPSFPKEIDPKYET